MNYYILIIAIAAFILQNQYFGWNGWPQSDAELITDILNLILLAMVFL